MNITSVGPTPFDFMRMTDKYIEEQGISSNNPANLPNNIANNTIENIQQQEYTNMKFATARLKDCVTRIGELCMERADKDYIHPVEVSYKEDNETHYFNVIGTRGKKAHERVSSQLPKDIVTLNRKAKIRVEADKGFGLTQDGRRIAMNELMKSMTTLYQEGFLGSEAMALLVKRYIEEYGYGSTEQFMEAIERGVTQGQMSQQQIKQMKVALLSVLNDAKIAGPAAQKDLVTTTKIGVVQAAKDIGLIPESEKEGKPEATLAPLVNLYKTAPPDIKRQIEQMLGLTPSEEEPVTLEQAKTAKELHGVVKGQNDIALATQDVAPQGGTVNEESEQGV